MWLRYFPMPVPQCSPGASAQAFENFCVACLRRGLCAMTCTGRFYGPIPGKWNACTRICFFVLFVIYGAVHFPCYLQPFGAGRCNFNCICICSIFWIWTSMNLQHFGAFCNHILELEAAISTLFAAFLSSNLSFFHRVSNILAQNTTVCNQGSFRVGFRDCSGFLLGWV